MAKTYLEEAEAVTRTDRQDEYGHPLINFARIAQRWNTTFRGRLKEGEFFTPVDVVFLMVDTKMARQQHAHKRDNLVDIIGYAACYERINEYMLEEGFDGGAEAFKSMTEAEFNTFLANIEHDLNPTPGISLERIAERVRNELDETASRLISPHIN